MAGGSCIPNLLLASKTLSNSNNSGIQEFYWSPWANLSEAYLMILRHPRAHTICIIPDACNPFKKGNFTLVSACSSLYKTNNSQPGGQ